jgi:hypothetical protein
LKRHRLIIHADIYPIRYADPYHITSISKIIYLVLLDIAISLFDDLQWQILIIIDLFTHLDETLLRHFLFIFGIMEISVQDKNSVGKSISGITRFQDTIGLILTAIIRLGYCIHYSCYLLRFSSDKEITGEESHKLLKIILLALL